MSVFQQEKLLNWLQSNLLPVKWNIFKISKHRKSLILSQRAFIEPTSNQLKSSFLNIKFPSCWKTSSVPCKNPAVCQVWWQWKCLPLSKDFLLTSAESSGFCSLPSSIDTSVRVIKAPLAEEQMKFWCVFNGELKMCFLLLTTRPPAAGGNTWVLKHKHWAQQSHPSHRETQSRTKRHSAAPSAHRDPKQNVFAISVSQCRNYAPGLSLAKHHFYAWSGFFVCSFFFLSNLLPAVLGWRRGSDHWFRNKQSKMM